MSGFEKVSVSLTTAASTFPSLSRLSRRASELSNGIILRTISPTEILLMTKLVQNLISYKKYSGNFQVRLMQIGVFPLRLILYFTNSQGVFWIVSARKNQIYLVAPHSIDKYNIN
jgi:hypothetical protein